MKLASEVKKVIWWIHLQGFSLHSLQAMTWHIYTARSPEAAMMRTVFLFLFYVCIYMWVDHMWMHERRFIHTYTCKYTCAQHIGLWEGGQKTTLGVVFRCLPPLVWYRVSHCPGTLPWRPDELAGRLHGSTYVLHTWLFTQTRDQN